MDNVIEPKLFRFVMRTIREIRIKNQCVVMLTVLTQVVGKERIS